MKRKLKMVIPKGRIYQKVVKLLNDSGYGVEVDERVYVPKIDDEEIEAKIMKPQNIPSLLELGSHDIGFTGHDWVMESGANVVEIMDLHFDPVKIVSAVPQALAKKDLGQINLIVASEYKTIARSYLDAKRYNYVLLSTYGATEVFPPDDADMIIDNVSTGRTLQEHHLLVIDTILESSTRLIANHTVLEDAWKREKIDEMKMIFRAVLDARQRVMLEMNVPPDKLEAIVKALPCMRSPTISQLYGGKGYAVKVAVKKSEVVKLIHLLKKCGAMDILEYDFRKVVL